MLSRLGKHLVSLIPQKLRDDLWLFQDGRPPINEFYAGVETIKKIEGKLKSVDTEEKVRELLTYCQSLYESEEKRQEFVENKSTILAGFAGTATAAILTLLVLFLDPDKFNQAPWIVRILSIAFSVIIFAALIFSTLFSLLALAVSKYDSPKAVKIFELARKDIKEVLKRRAVEYFYSYIQNQAVNDHKVEAYKYAVRSFRVAMVLVFFVAALIVLYAGSTSIHDSGVLTPVLSATSITTPTETSSPVMTLTPGSTFTPTP